MRINENYRNIQDSYLFSTVGKKVAAYSAAHPDKSIIRLGIGDVTRPPSRDRSHAKSRPGDGHARRLPRLHSLRTGLSLPA